ncbi:MAG: BrnA antitoxin family protein [Betaproteobacteria bacterium]|nr:BrnA antitoxin family protein [Betaproteobacteria bacterium]
MPRLKPGTIIPTPEEDAIITAAAMSDPDAMPLTDEEWEAVKPLVRFGRPPSTRPLKVPTTIRFDADVLAALKASGKGWQTRVNEAMREWVKTHSPV